MESSNTKPSKHKMKLKDIHGLEKLECGCKIKRYKGRAKTITIGCKIHGSTVNIKYVCRVCGQEFSKKGLKEHKWSHAQ